MPEVSKLEKEVKFDWKEWIPLYGVYRVVENAKAKRSHVLSDNVIMSVNHVYQAACLVLPTFEILRPYLS